MCDRFSRKFDVQASYKPSNYDLLLIFVVNIKFPRATYHTIVPSRGGHWGVLNTAKPQKKLTNTAIPQDVQNLVKNQ